jgi:hypothetical protein
MHIQPITDTADNQCPADPGRNHSFTVANHQQQRYQSVVFFESSRFEILSTLSVDALMLGMKVELSFVAPLPFSSKPTVAHWAPVGSRWFTTEDESSTSASDGPIARISDWKWSFSFVVLRLRHE